MIFGKPNNKKTPDKCPADDALRGKREYFKLEERRVLNATFTFDLATNELILENFVDSGVSDNSVEITQSGDDFTFNLNDGIWEIGGPIAGLDFMLSNGDSTLSIIDGATSLASIEFNDNTSDTFDLLFDQFDFSSGSLNVFQGIGSFGTVSTVSDTSSVSIGEFTFGVDSLDFSNGHNHIGLVNGFAHQDILVHSQSDLEAQILISSNGMISLEAQGTLSVDNVGSDLTSLTADSIRLVSAGMDSDVIVNNVITATGGNIEISAADRLLFTADAEVVSTGTGNISLASNQIGGNDFGALLLADGAWVAADDGDVQLSTLGGTGAGDVFVSAISTSTVSDSAISIQAQGSIFDGTVGESANLNAKFGGVQLAAFGGIGGPGFDDLNTDVDRLAFQVQQEIILTDVGASLIIDNLGPLDTSSAMGGGIVSANHLTISSDVVLGSTTTFFSIRSDQVNNDIVVNDNAIVRLDTTTDSVLSFDAADDLIFDTGRVVATGSNQHHVLLLADRELVVDGDSGSITNSAGMLDTVTTSLLTMLAGDGIGDSSGTDTPAGDPFRVNVDSMIAQNTAANGILIRESDGFALIDVTNLGRHVFLQANGEILDGDQGIDDVDVVGGDVELTSFFGSIGAGDIDVFKTMIEPIEVDASRSLTVNAEQGLVAVEPLHLPSIVVFNALSLVFASTGDVDAYQWTANATLNVTNLALIADSDNDGSGDLTIFDEIFVTGDLRLEGHDILAFDEFNNSSQAQLTADRLLLSTDTTAEFNTHVNQLDIEFDNAGDPSYQINGQYAVVNNSKSVKLIDLNCDHHSVLTSNDDVKILADGNITIENQIDAGSATLVLGSVGDLNQSVHATVSAEALGLMVQGNSILSADNSVSVFGASNGGATAFTNARDLTIGTVVFADGASSQMAVSGAIVVDADLKLQVLGSLLVDQSIQLQNGNLFLSASDQINQSNQGQIDAHGLGILAGGQTIFDADNQIYWLAAETHGLFVFNNLDSLSIDSVTAFAGTSLEMAVAGLSNTSGDVKLAASSDIKINRSIVATNHNVFIVSGGNVLQSDTGLIQADALGLMVADSAILDLQNSVDVFAGQVGEVLLFQNDSILNVGTVVAASDSTFEMSVAGIRADQAKIASDSDTVISSDLDVSATLFFNVDGTLEQSENATITSHSLGLMVTGKTTLTSPNTVDVLAASTDEQITFSESDNLIVGNVVFGAGTAFEMSIDGIVTTNDDIKITSGSLFIDRPIHIGSANALLHVGGDLSQSADGIISTNGLGLIVSGSTILNAGNDTNAIAAEHSGLFIFNDVDDVTIGNVVFDVALGAPTQITGFHSNADAKIIAHGDFSISAAIVAPRQTVFFDVDGNVAQQPNAYILADSLGLMVQGSSTLTASQNEVSVFAADNDDRVIFDNQIDLVIATVAFGAETSFEMSVAGITTSNDDTKISARDLFVEEIVQLGNGTLFLNSLGLLRQAVSGTIHADALGLMTFGNVVLTSANSVGGLAANTDGSFVFNNDSDLEIGTVYFAPETEFEMSVAGLHNLADTKLNVAGNLFIDQTIDVSVSNLFIQVDENVTQSATGSILAAEFGTMVAGDTILQAANNVEVFAANNLGQIFLNDLEDLRIESVVVAAGTAFEMSAVGITTDSKDASLTVQDTLSIEHLVAIGSGGLFLDVGGDLSQFSSGTISAEQLGLRVTGVSILDAANHVSVMAAANSGLTVFNNVANGLIIGSVSTFDGSPLEMSLQGIVATDQDVTLITGDLFLDQSMQVGSGTVFVNVDGDFSQSESGVVIANAFATQVTGATTLASANDADTFAANNIGLTVLNDVDDLAVDLVQVANNTSFAMQVEGISIADDDLKLSAGQIEIDSPVSVASGNVVLVSQEDIEQSSTGVIVSRALGVMATGTTKLDADNQVEIFSAKTDGAIVFSNAGDLQVGMVSLAEESAFEMIFFGIQTDHADTKLAVQGELWISESVDVGTETLFLDVQNNLSQTIDGFIVAEYLGLMVQGDTQLTAANQIHQIAADTTGSIVFSNVGDLEVTAVSILDESEFEMIAIGITTDNSDVRVSTLGNLEIFETVRAGVAGVFIESIGDIHQTSSGTIESTSLGVIAGGDVLLKSANDVDILSVQSNGKLRFNDVDNLTIGFATVFVESEFQVISSGIVNPGESKFTAGGNFDIQDAINGSNGTVFIVADGSISQGQQGTISGSSLGLQSSSDITLSGDNNIDVLAIASGGSIVFNDVDDLVVSNVSIFEESEHEMMLVGIKTDDSETKLSTGGNLTFVAIADVGSAELFLDIAQDLTQQFDGFIVAAGLGLMVDGDTTLALENRIQAIAFENLGHTVLANANELIVGEVSVFDESEFAMSLIGIDTNDSQLKLNNLGSLQIDTAIHAGTGTVFLVIEGDLRQAESGTIFASQFGMMVSGTTQLDQDNDVDVLAAENDGFSLFYDTDDLLVGTVVVASDTIFEMRAVGIQTSNDGAKLNVANNLTLDDAIAVGTGNVFLKVDGNLDQVIGDADGLDGRISANGLGIVVQGNTVLIDPTNQIDELAASTIGDFQFSNTKSLALGSVTVDEMTVEGVKAHSELALFVDGDLIQSSAIQVDGDALLSTTGYVCLTGGDCNGDGINDNDFVGSVTIFAGQFAEVIDINDLQIFSVIANQQIRLQAGSELAGTLTIAGDLTTVSPIGTVLLQFSDGLQQAESSVVSTVNLMLGSANDIQQGTGNALLNGDNRVENIAAELSGRLEFTNRRDLNIAPLIYVSSCQPFHETLTGIDVLSVQLAVTAGYLSNGDLTDAENSITVIATAADFNVEGNIVLGDGEAKLQFTDHSIEDLLVQNSTENVVRIAATGNGANVDGSDISHAQNATLFVDSSIVLSDVNVAKALFIDTIEATPANGSAGDILQSQIDEDTNSTIRAQDAAFFSASSVQLTQTWFDRLAVDANQNHARLIQPFQLNANIGSTFTGSIDANVFAAVDPDPFLLNGNQPLDGVFDVEEAFLNDGFFAGNNDFVNALRIGAVVVNGKEIELVSFDELSLEPVQLADSSNPFAAITTFGDAYIETKSGDLQVSANIDVTSRLSNITVIASENVSLAESVELRRIAEHHVVGVVNTIQSFFLTDHFVLQNPRSVIAVPGDPAFSDLNAQLDSAVGFQPIELFLGNPGEQSFNILIGWFVEGVTASEAISAPFQMSLLQEMGQASSEFLLSDFGNFGQAISAIALQLDSVLADSDLAIEVSNTSQFQQSFFADESFLLSQVFVTNDARINLFAHGGSTDLNFSQEVLPTRTVVQNPTPIVVDKPLIEIPSTPAAAPQPIFNFVNLIQEPESPPVTISQQPESFFLIRYTADDDGVFEESFKWTDPNDDPDAIRAAIERAVLNNDDLYWPDTEDEKQGNWTNKIKEEQRVKPGLYYIFEVQEGERVPEPVDAPVDRTDIENLIDSESSETGELREPPQTSFIAPIEETTDEELAPIACLSTHTSSVTRNALLSSSLFLGQMLIDGENNASKPPQTHGDNERRRMFSRASRLRRRYEKSIQQKHK